MKNSEKFWDNIASKYDQEEKSDQKTYFKMLEKTKKYFKGNDIVLDYGCGTGLISNEIANDVKVIHAIDTSAKMVDIAKIKAEELKIKNINYTHSTIFDERYKKGSYDVVLAFYILHLLEDTNKVMQRVSELLKPGGLIISTTPCMGEKKLLSTLLLLICKIGLVPNIRKFKTSELIDTIGNEKFEIVETECLGKRSQEYFIVAKKI